MSGISALSGSLIRRDRDEWRWRNGQPAPEVRDLSPDEWNFRCRADGSGQTMVEVLRGLAQQTDALAWVIQGWRVGRYLSGASGDHTGPRMMRIATDYAADGDERIEAGRMSIRPGDDPLMGVGQPLRGPIPEVLLVPATEWDAWVRDNPAGATWDAAHEAHILGRAWSLGWRGVAPGWISPHGWQAPQ